MSRKDLEAGSEKDMKGETEVKQPEQLSLREDQAKEQSLEAEVGAETPL